MSAEKAVYALLSGDDGVMDFVGSRIAPLRAGRSTPLPQVTYQRISTVRRHPLGQATDLASARVQVDCWAGEYDEAKALAEAVRAALNGYQGTAGGVTVQWIGLEGEGDEAETEKGATDLTVYRVRMDFEVWWKE